jgi:hypothetical protein
LGPLPNAGRAGFPRGGFAPGREAFAAFTTLRSALLDLDDLSTAGRFTLFAI